MRRWSDIKGYEGRYQVSDDGFVRSLPDIDHRGQFMPGRILARQTTPKGYLTVNLRAVPGGPLKSQRIHRLVAEAFVANTCCKPQVNHCDGVKSNNHWKNLEWSTNSENQVHRHRVLGQPSHHHAAVRATSKPVRGVHVASGAVVEYCSASEAARQLGVSQGAISQAASGKLRTAHGYEWIYR